MKTYLKFAAMAVVLVALLGMGGMYGATRYYAVHQGQHCADCHEMADYVSAVHG